VFGESSVHGHMADRIWASKWFGEPLAITDGDRPCWQGT
jgi:hypothetical protein